MPTFTKATIADLTKGVNLLLEQLPPEVGQTIEFLSKDYSIPQWQLVCGVLLEAQLSGRLSAFTLDPSWNDGIKQGLAICKQCKQPFKPARIGQIYCGEPCAQADFIANHPELSEVHNVRVDTAISDNPVRTRHPNPADGSSADSGWAEVPA